MPNLTSPVFKWADGSRITQQYLSEILGVSVRHLRRLFADPSAPVVSLTDFVQWYYTKDLVVDTGEGVDEGMTISELQKVKMFHDTRKAQHEANRSKLSEEREQFDFQVSKGDYVQRDAVMSNLVTAGRALSDLLFAFPERIITRIMGADDQKEVLDLIRDELTTITEEVASIEVIPD